MLSIDFIRQNKRKVLEAAKNKNREIELDKLLSLDDNRRKLIQKVQELREERNVLAKKGKPVHASRGKDIKESIKKLEDELKNIEIEIDQLILFIPNVPLAEVPIGHDSSVNKEIKKWGDVTKFDFKPKSHIELGLDLDLIDLKRGSKVSGFRGYFLKNELALLHFALLNYVFQKLTKKGYTPMIVPSIVKGFTLIGSGHFPWGKEQDVYKLNEEDTWLSGTAEVAATAYYSGEILNEKDLPKKFVAFSPCFRREAGAYGKDTKGLYRVHEFWKIEQVIIGKNDLQEARKLHEELQQNCEEILQELVLPYRILLMCTGDMGEPQLIKYDTETWMPSRNTYGETMSNSIMGDFQTRRLKIKYRTSKGETQYCYSFNNTALASPRILIAILENYQQKDGTITIPKVLQSLVGFEKITAKN
ncbi:serine--tRNA ligase [Candidatus Roizmanbacteria bacterium]|nr:serine--tRNA ligase [Candidatus Roizmanbacteria bacterium]